MHKLGNIVSTTKMFLNLSGNTFASATMFPELSKHGNIDRKHIVSATMFPSLPSPRALQGFTYGFTLLRSLPQCIIYVADSQRTKCALSNTRVGTFDVTLHKVYRFWPGNCISWSIKTLNWLFCHFSVQKDRAFFKSLT